MPRTVILWQDDFPFYDALPLSEAMLSAAFSGAVCVPVEELPAALGSAETSLLVLPHGSAFPFEAWDAIRRHLASGGHLLTIGGAPFSVPVYRQRHGFAPGRATVAYLRSLSINEAVALDTRHLDLVSAHASFSTIGGGWRARRSWALQAKLSDEQHYNRLGSMGVVGARLEPLLQAVDAEGRVLATPAVLLDHFHGPFAGSRWVMLNFEAEDGFNSSEEAVRLYSAAQRVALRGPLRFGARPALAVLAQGEVPTLILHALSWQEHPDAVLRLTVEGPDGASLREDIPFPVGRVPQHQALALPAPLHPGLHRVHLRLRSGAGFLTQYTTGYWCRDPELLSSGPRLSAGQSFLERDGRPLPIAGTTYMSRDAHRQFLLRPNPAHWHDDFAVMAAAGINFVRTGIWSGQDQIMLEPGVAREDTLRAFEAYLHCARAHGLAVQFCLFAFQPDAFGGGNPYLDPDARARQRDFVAAFVRRFRHVPDLSWDLINEPSQFDPEHLFQQRPHYDPHERRAWNQWLQRRYRTHEELLQAWNATPADVGPWGDVRPPHLAELSHHQRWGTAKPLMAVDWHLFSQDAFSDWARDLVETIRACGSDQMVTVGQDEGALTGRPSPFFHGDALSHTCIHTWWLNDALLCDHLCAALPGKPLLVQETGVMHYERLDQTSRRTEQNRAHLLERKLALALGAGAGFVQWLWNTNTDMVDDNEVAIGALRADGSEKPEMDVMRRMAAFAGALARYVGPWEPEPVLVVQPQAGLYSTDHDLVLRATQQAVRALAHGLGLPCRVLGENALAQAGNPDLVLVPYPRAFGEAGWQRLLDLARRGSTIALSGPMGDEHFHLTERLAPYGLSAVIAPVTSRHCWQDSPSGPIPLTYAGESLNRLDRWLFPGSDDTWWQADLGAGRLLTCAYPAELSQDEGGVRAVYSAMVQASRRPVRPWHTVQGRPEGALIWPRRFPGATLYTCLSESDRASAVTFRDERGGAELTLELASERAALVLLSPQGAPLEACVHGRLVVGGQEVWTGGDAVLHWDEPHAVNGANTSLPRVTFPHRRAR
ncbi:MAG: hypothetical protein HPY83_14360 [Anaerolineae bacterium]|nr:hypothetical protein [Anaerolineae bacterium]